MCNYNPKNYPEGLKKLMVKETPQPDELKLNRSQRRKSLKK